MSQIWFTSDTHFYHARVIEYCNRPYAYVEEMNEMLVLNWNAIVKPEDTVYVLGDFSLAFRAIELFSSRLMGNKILIPGNHDFCHSYHKKSRNPENRAKWIAKYEEHGWKVLPEHNTISFKGLGEVNLAHLPYTNDGDVRLDEVQMGHDKYAKYRPINDGKILLCGHVHEKWKYRFLADGTLMINVGCDVWGLRPVNLVEIINFINSLKENK